MIALDCTLRDGGYYNNWEFDVNLANRYLCVMEEANVDAVEIGFRSPKGNSFGKFANVTDDFINDFLHIPDILYFGVMINAKEITFEMIHSLFAYEEYSPINLVRVATHFKEVSKAEGLCKELKQLEYTVCCNLMQAADKSYDELQSVANIINSWDAVDVIYIADSMGGMNHDSIDYAFDAIWSGWKGLTGFHGHNNKGQSLNNSLEAVDIGVDWIDCTILGMGRGAGNTETEYLLNELNKRGFGEFNLNSVYDLVVSDAFRNLKDIHCWGSSLFYYIAAEYNIHPIYIQTMVANKYTGKQILNALLHLENIEASSFNIDLMKLAITQE